MKTCPRRHDNKFYFAARYDLADIIVVKWLNTAGILHWLLTCLFAKIRRVASLNSSSLSILVSSSLASLTLSLSLLSTTKISPEHWIKQRFDATLNCTKRIFCVLLAIYLDNSGFVCFVSCIIVFVWFNFLPFRQLLDSVHRTATSAVRDKMRHEVFCSNPTCLFAKTRRMASLSSSSLNILLSSSLASTTRSRSLLSTTKIKPE